jgi:hypothetical protein
MKSRRLEELKDIGIGNPDDDFPFLREKNGRARCRSDLTLLQWCEEVAKWANKTHVNALGHEKEKGQAAN